MYLIFLVDLLVAVFHNGASGDDADECILIIHHGNKVLTACPVYKIVHIGGDTDGDIVLTAGDLHDPSCLRLAHIHIAHILQRP